VLVRHGDWTYYVNAHPAMGRGPTPQLAHADWRAKVLKSSVDPDTLPGMGYFDRFSIYESEVKDGLQQS
jgi:hypothetical protein